MKKIRLSVLTAMGLVAASLVTLLSPPAQAQEVYLVNLTAEWCPNCKILDPRINEAATRFNDGSIERVELDFTNGDTMAQAYEQVNGTFLAGVFADYAGLTGLGVLVSADSGEKIDCVNRTMTSDAIEMQIVAAREIVRTTPIGKRETGSIFCPPANKRVQAAQ
ncbi:thioredoxin family protein [Hirschia litorea]|uniref:Thioredoxin family protein n=1 Tax=Hirschia litorea TaxID=1199156 RepID=A0ABW2IKQ2_9PROT